MTDNIKSLVEQLRGSAKATREGAASGMIVMTNPASVDEAADALEQQAARIQEQAQLIVSGEAQRDELLARIAELEKDADELSPRALYEDACIAANKNAKDARRYRWLRRRAVMTDCSDDTVTTITFLKDEGPTGEFLDDHVDDAIRALLKNDEGKS